MPRRQYLDLVHGLDVLNLVVLMDLAVDLALDNLVFGGVDVFMNNGWVHVSWGSGSEGSYKLG